MILINEDKSISLNNCRFPNYGWSFIIIGSPGSGKNFAYENNFPFTGKIFDVDDIVEKFSRYSLIKSNANKLSQNEKNNIRQNKAPYLIKKMRDYFFNMRKIKDNVIFFCCGRGPKRGENISLIEDIINISKQNNYKVCLIWVVCNRSTALQRNMQRSRTLPDKPFHQRTNQTNKFLPQFLQSPSSSNADIAFLYFSSGANLNDELSTQKVIKLLKTNNGFEFPTQDNKNKPYNPYANNFKELNAFLQPQEKSNNFTPQTYYSQSEIKKGENKFFKNYIRNIDENLLNKIISKNIKKVLNEELFK